jgi:CHAD domain-containing protein
MVMLTRDKQHKYLKKRSGSMIRHFDGFVATGTAEELHELRVDIKKIKALIHFSDNCIDSNLNKHYKWIRKVFKQSGLIRSAWLNIETITKNNVKDAELYNRNMQEFENAHIEFLVMSHYYRKKLKKATKKITLHLKDIHDKYILKEYDKKLNKLVEIYEGNNLIENLHESRKIIKDLIYVSDVLSNALVAKTKINLSYFKKLEDLIGKWHDNDLALELLNNSNVNGGTMQKLKQNTQKMLNRITIEIKEFEKKSIV